MTRSDPRDSELRDGLRSRPGKRPPETCPSCGAHVPQTALACPNCGADYQTGWNEEETAYDGLDLPDGEFDYDRFTAEEFGADEPRDRTALWWWIVAAVLLALAAVTLVLKAAAA